MAMMLGLQVAQFVHSVASSGKMPVLRDSEDIPVVTSFVKHWLLEVPHELLSQSQTAQLQNTRSIAIIRQVVSHCTYAACCHQVVSALHIYAAYCCQIVPTPHIYLRVMMLHAVFTMCTKSCSTLGLAHRCPKRYHTTHYSPTHSLHDW